MGAIQGAGPNKVSNEFMVLTFDNFCTLEIFDIQI